ncbi:MAG: HugZ family protein [Candidatus Methylomirabilales bacterium]
MSQPSLGRHAGGEPPTDKPPVPEPTYAERARTLVHVSRVGTLSTVSRKHAGWPFGSVMPYGFDDRGRPIFLVSHMAIHTQNMTADSRASLLVTQPHWSGDPLASGRVTLMGNISPASEEQLKQHRDLYLARYDNAKYWVDYEDFAFHRMEVLDVYFVGGFGVMGWVSAEEYSLAEPDPLADAAPGIIDHMNSDHPDALLLLVRVFGGIDAEEAMMTSVDRLGFHLRLRKGGRVQGTRIPFIHEVKTVQETRTIFVEMVQDARQRA